MIAAVAIMPMQAMAVWLRVSSSAHLCTGIGFPVTLRLLSPASFVIGLDPPNR
jgi:hypothetical protein